MKEHGGAGFLIRKKHHLGGWCDPKFGMGNLDPEKQSTVCRKRPSTFQVGQQRGHRPVCKKNRGHRQSNCPSSEDCHTICVFLCVCVSHPVSKGFPLAPTYHISRGQQGIHSSAANEDSCGHSVKQIGTPICVPARFFTSCLLHFSTF